MSADSTDDIVNELMKFEVGTKEEILSAIDNVTNKKDINVIVDYILNNKQKRYNSLFVSHILIYDIFKIKILFM